MPLYRRGPAGPGLREGMATLGTSRRLLRHFGTFVMILNIMVAGLSLSDMYLLASGAVRVELPTEKDFSWHFDANRSAIVFTCNYTVHNGGFYDITDLGIDASVDSAGGVRLVDYRESGLRIPAFGGGRYPIVTEMPVELLLGLDYGSMLFNGTHFLVHVKVGASYMLGMARFHSDETIRYPWKPPLENFTGLFLNGSLGAMLKDALPFIRETVSSLQSWAAAAILARGENVTVRAGPVDLGFRYHDGRLDIRIRTPGPAPQDLFSIALELPKGGAADD